MDPFGGHYLRHGHFLVKIYVKTKKLGPVGGHVLARPLDPPLEESHKSLCKFTITTGLWHVNIFDTNQASHKFVQMFTDHHKIFEPLPGCTYFYICVASYCIPSADVGKLSNVHLLYIFSISCLYFLLSSIGHGVSCCTMLSYL